MSSLISLRNKSGEIVYTKVSPEDYPHLNQFKWSKNPGGYAQGRINGKTWLLHRYIKEVLEKKEINGIIIDHVNRDKLDNTRSNLRLSNHSDNNRNATKKKGASSIYMGVSKMPRSKLWVAVIIINTFRVQASYKNEKHAAHQYNLWLTEYNLVGNRNEINETDILDFIQYKKPERKHDLPKGITKNGKMFQVQINCKYRGSYELLHEAENAAQAVYKKIEKEKLDNLNTLKEIKRNTDGIAIIKTKKGEEILVDDDDYQKLINSTCHVNSQGYACNNKKILMHRYILNYTGKLLVDHRNGNKLDNRKSNLRIVTAQQNSQNSSSRKDSSSKYVGVNLERKKWRSRIEIDGKKVHIGTFNTEEEAARARDKYVKEHVPHARLNFPLEVNQLNNFN